MSKRQNSAYISQWKASRRRVDNFLNSIQGQRHMDGDDSVTENGGVSSDIDIATLNEDYIETEHVFREVVGVHVDIPITVSVHEEFQLSEDLLANHDGIIGIAPNNEADDIEMCSCIKLNVNGCCTETCCSTCHSWAEVDSNEVAAEEEDENESDDEPCHVDLCSDLAQWACKYNANQTMLSDLLKLLQAYNMNVPSCSKTLLGTPRHTEVQHKSGGDYVYLGLASNLEQQLDLLVNEGSLEQLEILELSVNIDGLPLFSSSKLSLWPVLCKIVNIRASTPFVVAMFCGSQKPNDLEFIIQFIAELKTIMSAGLHYKGKVVVIKVHSVICDAPAKSLVKGIVQFNGYFGCDQCEQKGVFDGRMTYPKVDSELRSDQSFRSQANQKHHKTVSPFCDLSIDMIKDFPIDYMHQVNLGVTKRLLLLWINGPLKTRLSSSQVDQISRNLNNIKQYIPAEFARRPRDLRHVRMWKATEYRQFLMYSGQFVLKDVLPKELYEHFMCLHVALCILMSTLMVKKHAGYAKELLEYFVVESIKHYGQKFVTYNVHSLLHLTDVAVRYGCLQNCSAYPFESYMYKLKKLVRCAPNPLVQIERRLAEIKRTSMHCHEKADSLAVKSTAPNNCFRLTTGQFCLVHDILIEEKQVLCEVFHRTTKLYNNPCDSRLLGIHKAYFNHSEMKKLPLSDLKDKGIFVRLSTGKAALVPLMHNISND